MGKSNFGLVTLCDFFAGTLSFFQSEISVWMKPETHQSVPSSSITQTQLL
jgi:hypothetical protein